MEIILLENIFNLGKVGDKVNVKNGYGFRNSSKQSVSAVIVAVT